MKNIILIIIGIIIGIELIKGHEISTSLSAFEVVANDKDTKSVSTANGKIRCEFTYTTLPCDRLDSNVIKKKKGIEKIRQQDSELKKSTKEAYIRIKNELKSGCSQLEKGYWTYRVCLGGKITQFHGADEYILGKYTGNTKGQTEKTTLYENGQICDPIKAPRTSTINFYCYDKLALLNIEEPSQCHYELDVGHPRLCGPNSPYTKGNLVSAPTTVTTQTQHTIQLTNDPYLLEINAYKTPTNGVVMKCEVKGTLKEYRQKPNTCFASFKLEIKSTIQSKGKINVVAQQHQFKSFKDGDLVLKRNGVTTQTGFSGSTLEYLSLTQSD